MNQDYHPPSGARVCGHPAVSAEMGKKGGKKRSFSVFSSLPSFSPYAYILMTKRTELIKRKGKTPNEAYHLSHISLRPWRPTVVGSPVEAQETRKG